MRTARKLGWLAVIAWAACGCSSPSGGRLALFPEGYQLTEAAKEIRKATPPPPDAARELNKEVAGPFIVEPGDVLLVQASGLDSPVRLPGDQPVLPDGTIHLGRYGRLLVAGKTVEQVEQEVNALVKASEKEAGVITARLVTRESKVFYVLGEVNAPGSFQLRGRETALDAILSAGGLNSNASRRGIILSRPTAPDSCRVVLPVRFNEIVQLGDTTTNYQIRAGDRIYVPSRDMWDDLFHGLFHKKKGCHVHVACPPAAVIGTPVMAAKPKTEGKPAMAAKAAKPAKPTLLPPQKGPALIQVKMELPVALPER